MSAPRTPGPTPSRSIREPGAVPRTTRPDPRPMPPAPLEARAPRARPNPNPLRLMLGVAGLASAAAFTTAMLPSVATGPDTTTQVAAVDAATPQPSVQHVTRYVTLAPGQTAPPQSTVVVRPDPTPKVTVKIVTRTRQSGQP